MTLQQEIETAFAVAMGRVTGEEMVVPVVPAADLRFGDYQCNAAMALAKERRMNPRELATRILDHLELAGLGTAEIAGPGFINIRVAADAFARKLGEVLADERLGVPSTGEGRTVVIDFSAPNVAKPMHVGHIRSTIIGDALARISRFLGFRVITDNHIGDWGTQFGMILHGWKTVLDQGALEADPIAELLRVYREVNALAKADAAVMDQCRGELVRLQAGEEENLAIWRRCVELSRGGLQKIYDRLDVTFDHWLGESYYNERLGPLVEEFLAEGLARESDGAVCVFSGGDLPDEQDPFRVHNKDGWSDNPAIIRKADGGFLYATTDLATVDFRIREWGADAIWYVVGLPQALHFRQIFDACRRWGRTGDFRHIGFGSILGEDRKLMKTRSGDNVGLIEVLNEAVERAAKVVAEKNPDLPADEAVGIAEIVGIGAVKFAELSQSRLSDYVFAWDRMLALQGDTAPYLQNSYVRTRAIFRKAGGDFNPGGVEILLEEEREVNLARLLVRYGEVVPTVLEDHRPNLLANYLLEVARAFHSFYEACPVLKAGDAVRSSRLAICEATSRVLGHGLGLLGIRCPERM